MIYALGMIAIALLAAAAGIFAGRILVRMTGARVNPFIIHGVPVAVATVCLLSHWK
jgi:hypothetical protein